MAFVRTSSGTSSDSNTFRSYSYDIFLSFRGEETRKTFTDHLYTALNNAGFLTFRDDDELEREEDIKPGLQKAIQQSRTSVVVFSKDYASSRWCLDELVLILERKRTTSDYVVLPVFYDVDPSHVWKQTGSVGKAFARIQKNQSPEKVEGWRKALAEIADLAGMVLQNQADGGCDRLESLVGLREVHQIEPIIKKITFQSLEQWCRIDTHDNWNHVDVEGYYKIEPIDRVDGEMIKLLGLCNLESMPAVRMRYPHTYRNPKEVPVQGLYQYGIFSTFFVGDEVTGRFSYTSTKSSLSFIVPLLLASHRIRGLNIFATYANENSNNYVTRFGIAPIMIKVRNKSKGLKWIYSPTFYGIPGDGEDMIWLSHWKMENKTILQCGDEVVVSVITGPRDLFSVKEFGVELMQEHQDKMSTQHNTKSDPNYPYVIGEDLKTWKCRPGIYFLGRWTIADTDDIDILIMDSDEEDTNKEGQEDEPDYTVAKKRAASNNCSLGGWKVRLTAVGFFFALALVGWSSISQKKKRNSSKRPP
ncbi:hypothetical protein C1H46_021864 [Malus baccata]|uniref:ADP-ribosyl cyclase/cyclic ADP-ribose hydrolase n=1 Tax=Malus baccata TaxID=106549 RepID=A0A540M1F8_MALBA|nr:hypothetical protein C1H46_021864 [Malus baccata]